MQRRFGLWSVKLTKNFVFWRRFLQVLALLRYVSTLSSLRQTKIKRNISRSINLCLFINHAQQHRNETEKNRDFFRISLALSSFMKSFYHMNTMNSHMISFYNNEISIVYLEQNWCFDFLTNALQKTPDFSWMASFAVCLLVPESFRISSCGSYKICVCFTSLSTAL